MKRSPAGLNQHAAQELIPLLAGVQALLAAFVVTWSHARPTVAVTSVAPVNIALLTVVFIPFLAKAQRRPSCGDKETKSISAMIPIA